ncbi:hypothetical protein RR46_13599 [Papilio xuthus]|uniref:Uncharacterized protein n=1 Tax=Papilio xuthus TaxID=66420 RepID=A0A194PH53_PAPXU|nr:hypothetical protein RR46_13599 [Papilio xuthus]
MVANLRCYWHQPKTAPQNYVSTKYQFKYPRAGAHFGQRLIQAIQRGNAASLLGTLTCEPNDLGSIFDII